MYFLSALVSLDMLLPLVLRRLQRGLRALEMEKIRRERIPWVEGREVGRRYLV